jgi:ferredoxin
MTATVRVESALCIGSSNCAEEAPDVFEVGEDGIARLIAGVDPGSELALVGARACPVDAIIVTGPDGRRLHP